MFDEKGGKEREEERARSTLLREDRMKVAGRDIVTGSQDRRRRADGNWVLERTTIYEIAADGRWLKIEDFAGVSYTGQPVPRDRLAWCLNPFELHAHRAVYVGIDGEVTELRNVLCRDCLEHQRRRLFWRAVLLFGLLYTPAPY